MQIVDLTHLYDNANYPARDESLITHYNVHHSQGASPTGLLSAQAIIKGIDVFHRGPERNWPGIAYHRAAWEEYYFLLRRRSKNGWHTGGMDVDPKNGIGDGNDRGVACVILGTHTHVAPSDRTLQTIAEGKAWDEEQLQRPLTLAGHQDWTATACPGEGWQQWKHKIRLAAPPTNPLPVQLVATVPVPADYREKFGVAEDNWPAVAANLEGIIRMLLERENGADAEKLARIREVLDS